MCTVGTVAHTCRASNRVDAREGPDYPESKFLILKGLPVVEELYFSSDGKSLRRGQRSSKRRPIDRHVEMWRVGDQANLIQGRATDISMDGLMIEATGDFVIGDEIMVDVRRGKELDTPTFLYARARIVRIIERSDGLSGYGIHLIAKERKPDA